jgi:hypothetical protein
MGTVILVLLVLVGLLQGCLTVDFKKTTGQKSGKRPPTGRLHFKITVHPAEL